MFIVCTYIHVFLDYISMCSGAFTLCHTYVTSFVLQNAELLQICLFTSVALHQDLHEAFEHISMHVGT